MQRVFEPGKLLGPGVSRETIERLRMFAADVENWSRSINLIAPSTKPDLWKRHILDSAQLVQFAPSFDTSWCDLGSGGGLPGIVVSLILKERLTNNTMTFIESDSRKAAFLKLEVKKFDLCASVIQQRIENAPRCKADVVSARALAPLDKLLELVRRHLKVGGIAILPKGRNYQEEVDQATDRWHFNLKVENSLIDADSKILVLSDIKPKVG